MAMDERHSARSVWQGTKGDLEEVLAVVEEIRAGAVEDLQRELDAEIDARDQSRRKHSDRLKNLMAPSDRVTFADDRAREIFETSVNELVKHTESFTDSFKVKDAEDRIRDTSIRVYDALKSGHGVENKPTAVLPTMNPRKTRNIEIKFGSIISDPHLSVKFDHLEGVKVTAGSSNSLWVSGALNRLDSVLSQKRPWYAFLSSWWVSVPLCFIIAVLVTAQAIVWLQVSPDESFAWIVGIFGGGGFLFTAWTRVLFPKFELYNSGGQPTIKAILGFLVALVGLSPLLGFFSTTGT